MSGASQFASFAVYAPPPDEQQEAPSNPRSAWFQSLSSEYSYQSGGIPTFNASSSGASTTSDIEELASNQWETRYGWRVEFLACSAYMLGPISALFLLILETHNDYVRFHAYQSALLTTPFFFASLLISLARFPSWMWTFSILAITIIQLLFSFRAYRDASQNGLAHFHAPFVGQIAEQWLADE